MSRRQNLGVLLLALMLDIIMGGFWYVVLFPSEPVPTIAIVGMTLMGALFTVVIGFINWTVYQGCIADD